MILESLHLQNFKRFKDTKIDFPEGIIGICGENGSGKSSIVEGIVFALFGVQGTCIESDFIVSSSGDPKDKCTVRLEFSVDGETYLVERTFKKARSIHHDAHLYHGEILLADSVSGVAEEVSKIIGLNAIDLQHTVYSGQSDLKSIIDASPSVRKDWFMKVIGIDSIKKYGNDTLKEKISSLEGEIKGTSIVIQRMEENKIPDKIREINGDLGNIMGDREILQNELNDLTEEHKSLIDTQSALKIHKDSFEQLEKDSSRLMGELTTTDAALKKKNEDIATLSEENRLIYGMKSDHDDHIRLKSDVEQMEQIQKRIDSMQLEIDRLETRIRSLNGKKDTLKFSIRSKPDVERAILKSSDEIEKIKTFREEFDLLLPYLDTLKDQIEMKQYYSGVMKSITDRMPEVIIEPSIPAGYTETSIEMLEKVIRANEVELERSKLSALDIGEQIKEIEDNLQKVTDIGLEGICPYCTQEVGENYHTIIERMQTDIRSKQDEQKKVVNKSGDLISTLSIDRNMIKSYKEYEPLQVKYLEYVSLSDELSSLKEVWDAIDKEIMELSPKKDRYQDLKLLIDAEKIHLVDLNVQQGKLSLIQKAEEDLIGVTKEISDANQTLSELHQNIMEIDVSPEEYRKKLHDLEETKRSYELYLTLPVKMKLLDSFKTDLIILQESKDNLVVKLSDIDMALHVNPYRKELWENIEVAISKIKEELSDRINKIQMNTLMQSTKEGERARLHDELKVLEELITKKNEMEVDLGLSKTVKNSINGFLEYLLTLIRENIKEETDQIISEVTSGRYTGMQINENFDLLVDDITGTYPVARFSGGEQDVIAVALRIAVSRFISNLHQVRDSTFLIFDEIFGSQDPDRRNNLLRSLRSQENKFPQIILISHIPDIQDEFESIIEVKRINDKYSSASVL